MSLSHLSGRHALLALSLPLGLASLAACAAPAPPSPTANASPANTVVRAPGPTAFSLPEATTTAMNEPAPTSPIDALRDQVLASSQAWETTRSLVDEVGPRFAGSPGDRAAIAWALRTLTARGLQNVRAEKVKVPRWRRGAESARIVSSHPRELAVAALGGSVPTPRSGITADVLHVPSLETLEALDRKAVEGRIVFFSTRMERTVDGSGYGKAVGIRGAGPSLAARKGAVAVVIRSVGTSSDRIPHTGSTRYQPDAPKIPAAALSVPDAEMLERRLTEGPVRLTLSLESEMLADAESANVIGEVPGSTHPEEIVLLGAHLDSWDLTPGALDDAAGCAIVIEAGRAIASLPRKPRRTVRIVLFANEEFGLSGARAYAEAHADELPRHLIGLEADVGDGKVLAARFLGADAARPAFETLIRPLAPLGVKVSSEDARGGADLIPLRAQGVPVAELEQDATRYFDVHHTANDTMAKIVRADLDQAAAAFTTFAYAAADMSGDLGRIPDEKRRFR
ncbi:M20/M25/M40 family metallo-hydrolase [Chondromyces crocatus]|uniref:M20/M25/M40 family metallo-hydrolase n=1 Tax=Chondromyces crocatus TaxID=52 RepID=UPI0014701804|nr:M20/M25/M40 family metallo-hydrolase [Chondromyces crocatus]